MLTWRVVNSGVDCATPPSPPPPPPPPPLVPDPCAGPWQYSGSNPFALPNSSDATIVEYVRAHVSSRLDGPIESDVQGTSWTSDGNYPVVVVKSSTQFWLHVNVTPGAVLPTSSTNQNGNARGSVTSIGLCVSSRADLIYKT